MKAPAIVSMALLTLACGGVCGYLLRAQKTDGSLVLSLKDVVREDYFAPPDSFSKVSNTKHTLDGLSERLAAGIFDLVVTYKGLPKHTESERKKAAQLLEQAIQTAEAAMQEFEGTEQQLEVARSLLFALQEAGRFDRWTEVYLQALHEHPTHRLVALLADDAVRFSKLAGQQDRVREALHYVSAFESSFVGKAQIEAALRSAHPCFRQTRTFCSSAGLKQDAPE